MAESAAFCRAVGMLFADHNCSRLYSSGPRLVADEAPNPVAGRIAASLDYMLSHLDQPLSIQVLSGVARMSPSHFFRHFKHATGRSPMNYFIHARMSKARELIVETALSVKEIAAAMGFHDPFHFSRLFKSVHGSAPRHYRTTHGANRVVLRLPVGRQPNAREREQQPAQSWPEEFGKHINP
ncbi:MAG TPA: AraC family transcriptional regulator [Verrucomicrobiota bacterium]|nr:AraC family transcriptional regulator [Verrucomicrobiota bacterium]